MRNKVLLVVDDEPDMCALVEDFFEDLPLTVVTANTAEQALRIVSGLWVDIVLVDIFMPGSGGIWLIEQLEIEHAESKIIAMSGGWHGMPSETALKAAEKIGSMATINKPLDFKRLRSLICDLAHIDV